ncbi:hypothetical protein Tco_0819534 [Tanacetum coccineum]|uniref:Uncharacterized protein n=1 Tax=Tanacetum coccineum TaxID=301880 RepID=A0ABQ5A6V1_9ASTR
MSSYSFPHGSTNHSSCSTCSKFQGIDRCSNYVVLQSIPCSPECKIVGKILLDHPLSYALTTTADLLAVYLQQFWKTVNKVPDTKDTIIFKLDSQEIVYTIDIVGYQGVVDKTKINILQLFHAVVNRTNVDHAALLWIKEDYHSIKDDIPLVSVYTMVNVTVRGMLIPDAFLTEEIRTTDDFKEYETVFVNVAILMIQPQLVVSTQGTHMSTPRAHRTPTLSTASPQGKKRKQRVRDSSSPQKSLKITIRQKQAGEGEKAEQSYNEVDDFDNRLEPKSHKENPGHVDDDDNKEEEKVDEKEGNEMGSLEIRTEKMQTPIPTIPRYHRMNLSLDKNIYSHLPGVLCRMCRHQGYMTRDIEQKYVTTREFWKVHKKFDQVLHEIVLQLAERSIEDLIENNLKPCIAETIIEDRDAFRSEVPDLITKEFDSHAPQMKSNPQDQAYDPSLWDVLKFKDSTTYVSKQQQEWDAWVKEIIIDEDEATLNDMLNNQFKNAKESRMIWERVHDFQLGIESYQVKVNLTAPTLTFPGIEAHEPYSIIDKPTTGLIYLNNKDEKRVMYLVEVVKFCDAIVEKVLKEVKLKIFQSEP